MLDSTVFTPAPLKKGGTTHTKQNPRLLSTKLAMEVENLDRPHNSPGWTQLKSPKKQLAPTVSYGFHCKLYNFPPWKHLVTINQLVNQLHCSNRDRVIKRPCTSSNLLPGWVWILPSIMKQESSRKQKESQWKSLQISRKGRT